jgi:predicted nucleic-acid-binding Zn-ribbon protein
MDIESKLTQNFCCCKCRSRSAVAKTVALTKNLTSLLALTPDKYILVSCTLCGYTEVYNSHVYATCEEESAVEVPELPQQL